MAYQIPEGCPEDLIKYGKMLKFGIAEVAVRGKMQKDGLDEALFDQYLNPATAVSNKNIFDDDGDNVNENDIDSKLEIENETNNNDETKQFENDTNVTTTAQTTNTTNNVSKEERRKMKHINYQTSLLDNPNKYGPSSFSQTNFVPTANSQLKLDTLQPVPVKKTLLIVNTFVVHTAAFLNKFVATCESKLHKIHTDITRMETTLNILEGKLNSINWLSEAESGNLPNIPNIQDFKDSDFKDGDNMAPPPVPQGAGGAGGAGAPPPVPNGAVAEEAAPPAAPAVDPVKEDPALQKWFKMLKVGVPEQAVKNKMAGDVPEDIIERVIEIHRGSKNG